MHTFHCTGCSRQLTVSDEVLEQRMSGKKVALRCKRCSTPLTEVGPEQANPSASSSTHSGSRPTAATKPTPPALRRPVMRSLAASHTPAVASPPRPAQTVHGTRPTHARATAALRVAAVQPVSRTMSQVSLDATPSSVRLSATRVDVLDNVELSPASAIRSDVSRSQEFETAKSAAESPVSEAPAAEVTDEELLHDWELAVTSAGTPTTSSACGATAIGGLDASSACAASETEGSDASEGSANALSDAAVELDLPTRVMDVAVDLDISPSRVSVVERTVSRLVSRLRKSRVEGVLIGVNALIAIAAIVVLPRWGSESAVPSQAAAGLKVSDAPSQAVTVPAAPTPVTIPKTPIAPSVETVVAAVASAPVVAAVASAPTQAQAGLAKPLTSNAEAEDALPSYASRPAVIHLTGLAMRRAQGCHPRGHAVGTARVFVTFDPKGTVSAARLEGEPLKSAPVSRCILDHARSIRIPRFHGEPFTFSQNVTLR